MPAELVHYGQLTAEGQVVVAALDEMVLNANEDAAALNGLPPFAKNWYVNVRKLKSHTPASWLEAYPYAGGVVYDAIQAEKAKLAEEEQASDQGSTIASELETVKGSLAQALQAIDALKAELAALKPETPAEAEPPSKKSSKGSETDQEG